MIFLMGVRMFKFVIDTSERPYLGSERPDLGLDLRAPLGSKRPNMGLRGLIWVLISLTMGLRGLILGLRGLIWGLRV